MDKMVCRVDAPPTGQPASSLGGPPTTSTTPTAISGTLLIVGIAAGTSLVLINILIIGCCLHKRNTKQIKRGKWDEEVKGRPVCVHSSTKEKNEQFFLKMH